MFGWIYICGNTLNDKFDPMEDIKGFYFNFKEFTFELKRKVLHIRSELELEPTL